MKTENLPTNPKLAINLVYNQMRQEAKTQEINFYKLCRKKHINVKEKETLTHYIIELDTNNKDGISINLPKSEFPSSEIPIKQYAINILTRDIKFKRFLNMTK